MSRIQPRDPNGRFGHLPPAAPTVPAAPVRYTHVVADLGHDDAVELLPTVPPVQQQLESDLWDAFELMGHDIVRNRWAALFRSTRDWEAQVAQAEADGQPRVAAAWQHLIDVARSHLDDDADTITLGHAEDQLTEIVRDAYVLDLVDRGLPRDDAEVMVALMPARDSE